MSFIASTVHPVRRQGLDHVTEVWSLANLKLVDKGWALRPTRSSTSPFPALLAHDQRAAVPCVGIGELRCPLRDHDGASGVQWTIEIESRIGYELPSQRANFHFLFNMLRHCGISVIVGAT